MPYDPANDEYENFDQGHSGERNVRAPHRTNKPKPIMSMGPRSFTVMPNQIPMFIGYEVAHEIAKQLMRHNDLPKEVFAFAKQLMNALGDEGEDY